jgi:hypothetical protein
MSIRYLNNNNKVQTFLKQYTLENEEEWITRPVSLVVPMSQSMLWLCLLYQLQNYTLTTTMAHSPISSTHSFSSSMRYKWGLAWESEFQNESACERNGEEQKKACTKFPVNTWKTFPICIHHWDKVQEGKKSCEKARTSKSKAIETPT